MTLLRKHGCSALHRYLFLLISVLASACGRVGYDELVERSSASLADGGIEPFDSPFESPGSGGVFSGTGTTSSGGAAGGTPSGGATGGTSSGGGASTCEASKCPTSSCNIAKPFPCCNKDNTCGCSWASAFYCN